jgi:lycopene cyclase domain-containing protein
MDVSMDVSLDGPINVAVDASRYLLILVACLALTLPLELRLGARVYRQPRRLFITLLPVVAVFAAWDRIGAARGVWSFASRYTVGLRLLGLPIEEWLFFIVVPICALLTYEAMGHRSAAPAEGAQRPAEGTPETAEGTPEPAAQLDEAVARRDR